MSIDMSKLRKGGAAIDKRNAEAKGGSNFLPFTPKIYWKDGDRRYLMFLTPLDEIIDLMVIDYIPVKNKKSNGETYVTYEQVIARTDPIIGEDHDPIEDDWQASPKPSNMAVAVELEPLVEITSSGRKRPVGFEVKTTTFDRRVRNEKGELTDEVEEVVAPAVGFISQSPNNFGNMLRAFDSDTGPIHELPLEIKRVGGDKSTAYNIQAFDVPVDLNALLDNIEGISYLGDAQEASRVADEVLDIANDAEAAYALGLILRDKRLHELGDEARYQRLYDGITETMDKYGKKKGEKSEAKTERPARPSQRRSRSEDKGASTPEATEEVAEKAADEPTEAAPARTRRKSRAAEPVVEAPAATQRRKLSDLKARAAEKQAAA